MYPPTPRTLNRWLSLNKKEIGLSGGGLEEGSIPVGIKKIGRKRQQGEKDFLKEAKKVPKGPRNCSQLPCQKVGR